MATFPTTLKVLINTSETPGPVVIESEMERGVPKSRRVAADAIVNVPIEVIFFNDQQAEDFEDWFYDPAGAAGGSAWFDWINPRTKTTVQAQIVGGDIGALVPMADNYRLSKRSMVLRYVRSTM